MHTKKWVSALADRGCTILAFGLSEPTDSFYETVDNTEVKYSDFKNLYSGGVLKKVGYLKVVRELKKLCVEFQPDLIHAHYATSYGLLASLLGRSPVLLSVWGTDVYRFPNESYLRRKILTRNLRKADYIFSTSQDMARETEKYTDKTVNVVPFGVDMTVFKPEKEKRADSVITIGIVKTLEPVYGINYLIEAFDMLVSKYVNLPLKLIIVGDGSQREPLEKQARELGGKVVFMGRVPHAEVPQVFAEMDIVVIPSLAESFGVAAAEALACEKPVIASNVGGLPEVVIDNENGFLCPPGNAKAIYKKLDILIHDKERREKYGKSGRNFVEQNYNWENNADLMYSHYKRIYLESKNRRND